MKACGDIFGKHRRADNSECGIDDRREAIFGVEHLAVDHLRQRGDKSLAIECTRVPLAPRFEKRFRERRVDKRLAHLHVASTDLPLRLLKRAVCAHQSPFSVDRPDELVRVVQHRDHSLPFPNEFTDQSRKEFLRVWRSERVRELADRFLLRDRRRKIHDVPDPVRQRAWNECAHEEHGDARAVLANELFLIGNRESGGRGRVLCAGYVEMEKFRGRQVTPVHHPPGQVIAREAQHAEKNFIGIGDQFVGTAENANGTVRAGRAVTVAEHTWGTKAGRGGDPTSGLG